MSKNLDFTVCRNATYDSVTASRGNFDVLYSSGGSVAGGSSDTNNTAFGYKALISVTPAATGPLFGTNNVAFGVSALSSNTTGTYNTSVGSTSLKNNTIGNSNVAVGSQTLSSNATGSRNVAIGTRSLYSCTGSNDNTAVGHYTLEQNISGNNNVAIGSFSLKSNLIGSGNTSIGKNSLFVNSTGDNNTAVGNTSLYRNTTGSYNVAIGAGAGNNITTGSSNIVIGYAISVDDETDNNKIYIGDNSYQIKIFGNGILPGPSDKRDKTEIQDLKSSIDFINEIKTVTYKWDRREWYPNKIPDGSKKKEKIFTGFLAQDLQELQDKHDMKYLNLVSDEDLDSLSIYKGELMPVIVKAFQELTVIVKSQKEMIDKLSAFVNFN
jgi:hypothetical protein